MSSNVENVYITKEDFQKFISHIPELPVYKKNLKHDKSLALDEMIILFKLMYYCALKVRDVLKLEKEDFDIDERILHLRTVQTPLKMTTIPPIIIEDLSIFLKTKKPHTKLFDISYSSISQSAKKIGNLAGLKIFKSRPSKSVHGVHTIIFRHSYAQFMLNNGSGSDLSALKLRSTTFTNYNNKTIQDLKNWESKLEFVLTYGIVVIGDVLGTKGIWREKLPGDVITNWSWLVKKSKEALDKFFPKSKVNIRAFSDTLLITASGSDVEQLLLYAGNFLSALLSLCLVYDFPIRGVFSLGEFVDSEQMIIGPAIDEAASCYEQSDWIGFSATPSAFSLIEKLKQSKKHSLKLNTDFIKYDVPLHNGKTEKQNWAIKLNPNFMLTGDYEKKTDYLGMSLIDIVNYKLQHPRGSEAGTKWKNMLLFLNHIEQNKM